MAKLLSKTAASINLFKVPIRLKIRSEDYFSSRIGEFLSLLIYAYLLNSLITSDVFTKNNPNILEKEVDNSKTFWYNFTERNFIFGAMVSDSLDVGFELDPKIASFMASYNTFTGSNTKNTFIKLPLVLCKNTYAKYAFPQLITQYPSGYCLPNPRFLVGGYFDEVKTSSLEIILKMCVNSTSNNNSCRSQSEIDEFFTNKRLGFLTADNLFASDDYENPIRPKINVNYYNIDTHIRKFHNVNIQKVTISNDDGIFFSSSSNVIDSWKIGEVKNDFDFNYNLELFQINFFSTIKETQIHRTYMKIQYALSSLGGIVNVFISVGLIFLKLFSPISGINVYLSNHLFSFRHMKSIPKAKHKDSDNSPLKRSPSKKQSEKFELKSAEPIKKTNIEKDLKAIIEKERQENVVIQLTGIPSTDPRFDTLGLKTENDKWTQMIETTDRAKIDRLRGDEEIVLSERQSEEVHSEKYIKDNFMKKVDLGQETDRFEKSATLRKNVKTKSFIKKMTFSRAKSLNEERKIAEHFKKYSELKDKKNGLKFEYSDLIPVKGRSNLSKKMKALKTATNKIKKDLDIMNIMQKFQEIDKLKLLLLNRQQLMLFDLIAKPEIFLDENEKQEEEDAGLIISKNLMGLRDGTNQNFLDLVVYYNQIKNKEGGDDLEGRLVRLIDEDMKNYFEV